MLDDGLLSPLCLECPACTPGCPPIEGELPAARRAALRERLLDLLEHPAAPIPRQCWHCSQAPCVEACPAGAMRRDAASRLVWVDRGRCVGCWMCVLACPLGAVLPSAEGPFAVKCDGCPGREEPACAGSCPPRDALFSPDLTTEAVHRRRAGFAAAGWGWPGPASYPPPTDSLRSLPEPSPPARPHRYVLVGGGIAAVRAAEAIREADARGGITVISDEATAPYSRVLLSHHLAGLRDRPSLDLRPVGWSEEMGIEMVAGDGAVGLDPDRRRVALRSGRCLDYDRLLIATGALPARLPVLGADLEGVLGLRHLADAATIVALAPREAVVVGGGFIGLKAAEALHQLGARVAVVEKLGRLLPQMLDGPAAEMVRERLEARGIRVLTGVGVGEICGPGRVGGVLLESGERLRCDLVVVGVGVSPNVAWLRGSRVPLGRGVIVDEQMSTAVPDVWAAGDVAEGRDLLTGARAVSGLWPVAAAQGRVAGANMAGGCERFAGSLPMNTLDLFGLAVASFGQLTGEREEVVDQGPDRYQKRVYRDGILVGAVLVGDLREAGRLLAQVRCRHG